MGCSTYEHTDRTSERILRKHGQPKGVLEEWVQAYRDPARPCRCKGGDKDAGGAGVEAAFNLVGAVDWFGSTL